MQSSDTQVLSLVHRRSGEYRIDHGTSGSILRGHSCTATEGMGRRFMQSPGALRGVQRQTGQGNRMAKLRHGSR